MRASPLSARLAAALVVVGLAGPAAAVHPDYERGKAHWLAGEYREAHDLLLRYRASPFGRQAEVDYMLATAACRLPERAAWGRDVLGWMLYAYPLPPDSLQVIAAEQQSCAAGMAWKPAAPPSAVPVAQGQAGMEASGKHFIMRGMSSDLAFPARRERALGPADIARRLLPRASTPDPVAAVRANLAAQDVAYPLVARSKHFVLATAEQPTPPAGRAASLGADENVVVERADEARPAIPPGQADPVLPKGTPPPDLDSQADPQYGSAQAPDGAAHEHVLRIPGFEVKAPAPRELTVDVVRVDMLAPLEDFLAYLQREYGVPEPDQFITVYALPHNRDLVRFALGFHGLAVSPVAAGYVFPADRSVVGVATGTRIGTLHHELLHLLVRSHFGDIPLWLDEGLASLYEAARWHCGGLLGGQNWRGKVLRDLWSLRPSVAELVTNRWSFDTAELAASALTTAPDDPARAPAVAQAERLAARMAMARYFALYLQERGQLPALYRALRERPLGSEQGAPVGSAVAALVERVLGQPLAAVDQAFATWFDQTDEEGLPLPRCP